MIQAIRSGLEVMLERDPNVCVFGEDVGYFGGVFRATQGLQKKFGAATRVRYAAGRRRNHRASRSAWASTACGRCRRFSFPITCTPRSIRSRTSWRSFVTAAAASGRRRLTIRAPSGGGIRGGLFHSQSPEAYYTHTPGLCVVMPSNPHDAKGLLISSIECDDPVIFLRAEATVSRLVRWRSGKRLAVARPAGSRGAGRYYRTPIGQATVVRAGEEVTVITWGTMVHVARAAISQMRMSTPS